MKKITMNPNLLKNKTSIFATLALISATSLSAQTFTDFQYKGNDKIYNDNPLNRTNSIPRFFRAVIPIQASPKKEMIIIW
jgi:alpha-N-arabinofuranosidase